MKRFSLLFPVVAVAASLVAPLLARASDEARDPFRPFFVGAPVVLATVPLQRFALDDLHIEGIVSGISQPRALVHAPDGETYEVAVGGLIGNHNGHVAQITKDAVVIVELADDAKHEVVLGISPSN